MTQTEKSQTATTGGSLPGFDPKKKKGAAALPFIALDTETGGTRPGTHALLSIAAVASWRDEAFIVYIEPGNHLVDPAAARINGYTPELWDERGCLPLPAAPTAPAAPPAPGRQRASRRHPGGREGRATV